MAAGRWAMHDSSDELLQKVYEQLRKDAQLRMCQERPGHTLQATALVHDAYVRLARDGQVSWENTGHFYTAAAEAMRRILIEHARKRGRLKRGGDARRLSMSSLDLAAEQESPGILAFDEALGRLERVAADAARIVRLRFFAGLGVEETARVLGVSPRTVDRGWTFARAWLYRELED